MKVTCVQAITRCSLSPSHIHTHMDMVRVTHDVLLMFWHASCKLPWKRVAYSQWNRVHLSNKSSQLYMNSFFFFFFLSFLLYKNHKWTRSSHSLCPCTLSEIKCKWASISRAQTETDKLMYRKKERTEKNSASASLVLKWTIRCALVI